MKSFNTKESRYCSDYSLIMQFSLFIGQFLIETNRKSQIFIFKCFWHMQFFIKFINLLDSINVRSEIRGVRVGKYTQINKHTAYVYFRLQSKYTQNFKFRTDAQHLLLKIDGCIYTRGTRTDRGPANSNTETEIQAFHLRNQNFVFIFVCFIYILLVRDIAQVSGKTLENVVEFS